MLYDRLKIETGLDAEHYPRATHNMVDACLSGDMTGNRRPIADTRT